MIYLDRIANSVNESNQELHILYTNDGGSESIFYLKNVLPVEVSEEHIKNWGGLRFQIDSGNERYDISFVRDHRIIIPTPGKGISTKLFSGTQSIVTGLDNLGHWKKGIGFCDKNAKLTSVLEIFIENKLV